MKIASNSAVYSTVETIGEVIEAVRINSRMSVADSAPLASITKEDWGIRGGWVFDCGHTATLKENVFTASLGGEPACPFCTIKGVAAGDYRIDLEAFANAMGRWVFEGSWPADGGAQ